MKVIIIENSFSPYEAKIMLDDKGNNIVFDSHKTAYNYLKHNSKDDTYYKAYALC